MPKKTLLSFIRRVISILTWPSAIKILIIFCIFFLGLISLGFKDQIFNTRSSGKLSLDKPPLELSKDGLDAIERIVRKSDLVVGIGLVSVNFQQNSRRIIYFNSDNAEFVRLHDEYVRTHISVDQPLFNDDQDNNKRIIKLINGDVICTKYTTTLTYKYAPNVGIDTTCIYGVPPYYGQFRGFIVVYLQTEPTSLEFDQVKILLRDLSTRLDNPKSK